MNADAFEPAEHRAGSPDLSFIIPTFRETAFGDPLDALLAFLTAGDRGHVEILVADDSDPPTQERLRDTLDQRRATLPPSIGLRLLPGPRRGKGAAVRLAALASRGRAVFVVDADLPVPLHFVDAFLDELRDEGADVVIGERPADRYPDNPLRRFVARSLQVIQHNLVFHEALFDDTQCGFKAFRGDVLRSIASRQLVDGGMYDLEYLYAATVRQLKVVRVDVAINPESRPSRINVWRCILYDPMDILRFRMAGALGRYGTDR